MGRERQADINGGEEPKSTKERIITPAKWATGIGVGGSLCVLLTGLEIISDQPVVSDAAVKAIFIGTVSPFGVGVIGATIWGITELASCVQEKKGKNKGIRSERKRNEIIFPPTKRQ